MTSSLELGISFILTIFVYLAFPLIYIYTNGKVSNQKGKKIALINSAICCGLFCIIRAIISGGEVFASSFAPAVLYYFIAKLILVDKKISDESQIINDEEKLTKEFFYNMAQKSLKNNNLKKALYYYDKSANLGCEKACMILGYLYFNENNDLVDKNLLLAKEYFQKAEELGNKDAQKILKSNFNEKILE